MIQPLAVGDWTQSPASLTYWRSERRAESSNPLITGLVPRATSIHPEATQGPTKSHRFSINSGKVERGLLFITKDTLITEEMPRVLEALFQEPETKTKYIFPIMSHRDF